MAVQRDKVLASAEKLVAKGKIEPAIKEYERLLEDNPNDVNTLNRIGDLWVRINRTDEAVKVFSKIADHYAKDGFFLKAIAIFKKINKLDPSKLDVYARLADLYAKQGLAMEAKSQYQVLADYYIKHGEPSNALAIYRKISDLDPNSINVHVKLADLYSQNNQVAEALKEYDRVGKLLLKRGMLDEAVQVFRKALKIDSKNVELVDSLVTALLEAKDFNNAAQIVQTALETNGENARLLATMGRIQLARGDVAGAQDALQRAVAADPTDNASRSALADVALRRSDLDTALRVVEPVVKNALARSDRAAAVEPLNKILRADAGHAPTIELLIDVYTTLNEETSILAAMNSLAEAHMARGRFDEAGAALEKLIAREPQNSQHRTKLQFVRSQTGGVDTMPALPKDGQPSLEIDEPPPSFDTSREPEPHGLTLDLDASPSLELDLDSVRTAPSPAPAPQPSYLMAAVEIAAQESGNEDLDFITEHLTEAEVFAKYGLTEKAVEHLRAIIDRAPKHQTAHERLFRILLDEGDVEAARKAALAYVGVLRESGNDSEVDGVTDEFMTRGIEFSPGAAAPAPSAAAPPPQKTQEISFEPSEPEMSFDSLGGESSDSLEPDEPEELEFEIEEPEPAFDEPAAEPELPVEEPAASFAVPEPTFAAPEPTFAAPEPTFDVPDSTFDVPEPTFDVPEPLAEEPEVMFELTETTFEEAAPAFGEAAPAFEEAAPSFGEPELTFEGFDNEPAVEETAPADLLGGPDETPAGETGAADEAFELSEELPLGFDEPQPTESQFSFGEEQPQDLSRVGQEEEQASGTAVDEPSQIPELNIDDELPEMSDAPAVPEQEPAFAMDELFGGEEPEETPDQIGDPPLTELGEIDFYIDNDLLVEAGVKLDILSDVYPGSAELQARRDRLEMLQASTPAPPATLSPEEIESELLSAIPEDDDDLPVSVPQPAATPQPSAPPVAARAASHHDENLFADEEDFFDLAAELESELAEEEDAISVNEEEQSLEEIFKEFKKGVEQQLDSEDYDTHYNLGIAYKEMGLIDEAIGEFQLASKDPKRAVECASMLGLCFLEKGMPQLAIKWYRKGLEIPEITEDEHIGLLYDLGSAHQEVGDTDNAQKTFMEVYGMNSNYRDIVGRIKQLEDA